jgi:hypothetical protein
MSRKTAGLALLGISVVLAVLLLTYTISAFTSSMAFAVALVLFGLTSRGFTRC